ncbi:MAG: hypothetical protein JWP13_830 [Candidatus Saccharibacteria bacterium]|nr:hypothetical protein [Candidatus Saccharibacteria bacterium]
MKRLLLALLMAFTISFNIGGVAMAQNTTQPAKDQVCEGVSGQFGGSCTSGGADIDRIIKVALNILSWVAGIAAVIMIVIAGLRYITSGGDSSSIAGAKNALIYALVGVVVVAVSQGLVFFILGNVT